MTIYDKLNEIQREAVMTTEGPLLILAGAGSGKTRALTHRVAYLIEEKGVAPWNIMAITFTNKAAGEMKERVEQLVGQRGKHVWIATFHSSCVRILRKYAESIGYNKNFTIYDTDDQKALLRQLMKRMNIDVKQFSDREAIRIISKAKEEMITPVEFMNEKVDDYRSKIFARIYAEYQEALRKNNAMDFDDLLVNVVRLFEKDKEALAYYQDLFHYVHVDEYQDTNTVQFQFVKLITQTRKNICVVGDDDQSIYRFRGADITNILSFEKIFPNAKVIKLEQNYRSTPDILQIANEVIKNNSARKPKRLWTEIEGNKIPRFTIYEDAYQEATAVIGEMRKAHEEGLSYSECAVLYRTNAQSRTLEEACIRMNIPYRIVGGVNFYQRAEIKDIIAYLKTISNGQDDVAVRRIINVPRRGIGATTIEKITELAIAYEINFFDACELYCEMNSKNKSVLKVKEFVDLIVNLRIDAKTLNVYELMNTAIERINYYDTLSDLMDEKIVAKRENINELCAKAAEYVNSGEEVSLEDFLEQIALVSDLDSVDEAQQRLLLMTLHGAKGLEFDKVCLVGLEDGLFPSFMSIESGNKEDIEEERRLFYVGVTRARKQLDLSAARARMINGETKYRKVSRFVEEIPEYLIKKENPHVKRVSTSTSSTKQSPISTLMPMGRPTFGRAVPMKKPESLAYKEGDRVRHIKFGVGTVIKIVDMGKDYEVTVEFDGVGVKKMMSAFANLSLI